MRKVRLQATPLTDETFKRQGWSKHITNDYNGTGDFIYAAWGDNPYKFGNGF